MPSTVSDAGPLIHLAQISKLHLLKKLFKRVSITTEVKREVVDEGIRLGQTDVLAVRKAIEEGWIKIQDIPESTASAARKLAEGENLSRSDSETLVLAKKMEQKSWSTRKSSQTSRRCTDSRFGTPGQSC